MSEGQQHSLWDGLNALRADLARAPESMDRLVSDPAGYFAEKNLNFPVGEADAATFGQLLETLSEKRRAEVLSSLVGPHADGSGQIEKHAQIVNNVNAVLNINAAVNVNAGLLVNVAVGVNAGAYANVYSAVNVSTVGCGSHIDSPLQIVFSDTFENSPLSRYFKENTVSDHRAKALLRHALRAHRLAAAGGAAPRGQDDDETGSDMDDSLTTLDYPHKDKLLRIAVRLNGRVAEVHGGSLLN